MTTLRSFETKQTTSYNTRHHGATIEDTSGRRMEEAFLEVRMGPKDPNYALSFDYDDLSDANEFFERYGYVVRVLILSISKACRCSGMSLQKKNVRRRGQQCGVLLRRVALDSIEMTHPHGQTIILLGNMVYR